MEDLIINKKAPGSVPWEATPRSLYDERHVAFYHCNACMAYRPRQPWNDAGMVIRRVCRALHKPCRLGDPEIMSPARTRIPLRDSTPGMKAWVSLWVILFVRFEMPADVRAAAIIRLPPNVFRTLCSRGIQK